MEAIELIELISRGEDSRTQFKQSQDVTNAKSLAGEMVAFANSKGGRILIGVDDAGSSRAYARRHTKNQSTDFQHGNQLRPALDQPRNREHPCRRAIGHGRHGT